MLKGYSYWSDESDIYSKFPKLLINEIDRPLFNALDIEIDKLKSSYVDLINQMFIDTATWGLEYWEQLVCINTNYAFNYETRRSNIKAEMRRQDITTKEVIKSVAEAYSNGECEVIENFSDYSFTVKFIGVKGIPAALSELDKVINKIKPCHLAHAYEYSYLTWDEFDGYNWTWDELDALNLTWNELEIYTGGDVIAK